PAPRRPAPNSRASAAPIRRPSRKRTIRLGKTIRRLWASVAFVGLLLAVVLIRLVWLQGVDSGGYKLAASDEMREFVTLHAARGSIVDRNGVPLAYTADAKDIVADPTLIKPADRPDYAALLSPLVGKSVTALQAQLTSSSHYALLATALSPAVAKQIEDLTLGGKPLPGIFSQATLQRLYPGQSTGSNVVGLVQSDGAGAAGIEYSYDSVLRGTDGSVSYEKDSVGNVNPAGSIKRKAAMDGGTVRLTIDQDLQYTVQKYLDQSVKQSGARGGQVTILDVKTGQTLAMAASGSFNPQDPSTIDSKRSLDPNIQQVFEPGSANKIVTMTAAVEKGLITPRTVVTVPDAIQTGGITVHDAWWHPVQQFTATGILAESSNVGTLLIAQKVGPQSFDDYLKRFGLGQKTGIELPGESAGLLPALSDWSAATFANLPIGQGVAMTSLQLASMYQAVANNGLRIPPRIVGSVTAADGLSTPTAQPAGVQVMSPATAKIVRTMLESVTLKGGTGTRAAIPGYRVAGKTGTAQQPDPKTGRYSDSVYWDTFAGMVPADNPQFVVSIMIDNPAHGLEGGDVAAPLFHHVATYELSAAKIPPTGSQSVLVPLTLN
ncbi:MAG: peptidoglycan D,D-transpeptidase FtsI family protein, partial [Jatrophihabitans sp.]